MKSEDMVRRPVDRRGIVLILALGMLALFTVVAITLASISRTQATAAGNFKRLEQYGSNTLTVRPDEVNDLFRYALNQLVYDTRNRQSAIRGHSLLRDMYGSPTTYSLTTVAKNPVPAAGNNKLNITSLTGVGNDGAELRLKKEHLQVLLNIDPTYNDPRNMALDYQKVYNGTGLFPPRKIDFITGFTGGSLGFLPTTGVSAGTILDTTINVQKSAIYMSNAEIATQIAFMNVPGRLMPTTPSIYPSTTADWKSLFLNPFTGYSSIAGLRYWLPIFPVNYTEFDAFSPNGSNITRAATGASIDPERFTYVVNGGTGTYPQGDHWFGADEDYDYPDINNMFLAMERADGKMLIPSFHRPGIIAQVAAGVNDLTGYNAGTPSAPVPVGKLPWLPYDSNKTPGVYPNPPADFHGLVLRPRAADRDAKTLGIVSPRAGRFRELADVYNSTGNIAQDGLPDDLDGSGFIGDHPTELDVDTDGDGQNDSVWVDLGAPVIQVGDSAVKPLFAFKVIGMDGKINLNTAGNLYKAPTPENNNKAYNWGPPYSSATEQQFNYTLLHKSNLGASPTEVNPQYGFILGDNPGILPSYLPTAVRPPSPVWGLPVGTASIYDPYQRLLEGFTNLYTGDQAPGRWTGRPDSITGQIMNLPGIGGSDDNGNLTNPSTAVLPGLSKEESFDRNVNPSPILTRNFDYSEGDGGDPIGTIGTVPAGTPAIQNRNSPADFYGLGTRYSPFSHVVQAYESAPLQMNPKLGEILKGAMGVGSRTDASIVPFYLNYAGIAGGALGASIKALDDGKALSSPSFKLELLQKGLGVERLLANEPTETNVYYSNDDSLFGAADVAALLRANDFDGSTIQSRIESLLPDQLGKRSVEISPLASNPTPNYFTSEGYGRRRMRNLFTHESWDLIRYCAPPTFHSSGSVNGKGKGLFLGPAVVGSTGEMLDISGNSTYLGTDVVASYVARSHSGEGGPNFISQLLSYKLPMNGTAATPIASAGSTYADARDVYEQLSLAKTIDGKDFLIPYEVQMGRRFDLNRPLTAYTTGNAGPVDLERESLAQQIYVLLALSSGSCGVDPTGKFMTPQARLAQARTIAQIAVNIVDYMDPDNVMTMMRFDPDLSDGWDNTASPTLSLTDDSGSASISPTSDEYKSITRVMGFELPDLVINESLAIFTDNKEQDPANPSQNIRFEYMFTWIELFNPWPETIDPADASKAGGVLLAQASGESIYLIQLNRLNESTPNGTDSPPLAPIGVVDGTTLAPQLIRFNAPNGTNETSLTPTNSPIDGSSTVSVDGAPASSPVVVHGRNSSATSRPGYFVIGPASTLLTSVPGVTFPTIAGSGTPDYSASACILRKQTKDPNTSIAPRVDIRLYRKRNPLVNHDSELNPYVVVDSLSQPFSGTEIIRKYNERQYSPPGGPAPTSDLAAKGPVKKDMGVYFVKNTVVNDSERPTWAATAPSVTGGFESAQRRQPWHGFNRDWTPYPTGATHPLNGKVLGNPDQNIEGYFLGLPSLIDPRKYSSSSISGYVPNDDANGMRQNGFGPATVSLGTVNSNALKRWASFPFLNRQLATPLELLSVRLYGSHLWFLPTSPAVKEWRLRFTDDFEFFPHAWRPESYATSVSSTNAVYERLWRSRLVPWYQDGRVTHPTFSSLGGVADLLNPSALVSGGDPTQAQLPLPHLYRFFELVECRSRMNNGVPANQQWVNITPPWPAELTTALPSPNPGRGSLTPTVPVPSTVTATQRAERTPGKINLNLITEEEVYRALLDSVETAYFDVLTDLPADQGAYEQNKNYAFSISTSFWPVNYWDSLFTPLGKAPLGDQSSGKALDVVDALGRLVAWSTLTLNNTTSPTVITPPLAGSPGASVLSTGGFDIRANQLFGSTVVAQTTSFSQLTTNASNLARLSPTNVFMMGSPNRQFPGIVDGAYNPSAFDPNLVLYPGTNPDRQVHSEMYRAFLLSRSGPDGIHGTADDKPFRSYASDDVSDTILRVRNSATNGLVKEGSLTSDGTSLSGAGSSAIEALSVVAKTFVDGSNDLVSMTSTGMSFYMGDYIARLGGQRIPGLFDPIADPYSDYYVPTGGGGKNASIPHLLPIGADPADPEFQERLPSYASTYPGSPEKLPVDYWTLEERRNELLAKISGNVTTRSHVFAVWVTVGFFRVEPGTEGLKVPLLGAEVGSESGKAFRHRAFFIIDRSQAKSYDPEDIDANFDFDIMRKKKLLEYYKIIE